MIQLRPTILANACRAVPRGALESASMATDNDLLELAARCIRGEATVYAFAEAVAAARQMRVEIALFGETSPHSDCWAARAHLKAAHYAATRNSANASRPYAG